MVALMGKGPEIIAAMRTQAVAKGYADTGRYMGRVSTFCKQARLEAASEQQIDIVTIATTDDIDLEGEVVLPDGIDWTYLERNKAIFLDHMMGGKHAVATYRSKKRLSNGWLVRASLINDPMDESVRIVHKLAKGDILGMSIGFQSVDDGPPNPLEAKKYPNANWIIRKCHVIEVSYTPCPCNVACRTQNVIYGPTDDGKVASARDLLTKSNTPAALMESLGLVKPKRVVVWMG